MLLYMLPCVQSVRSASPICLRRSSSATPTANTRTGPVTGASTPQTGHLTFRFADNLLPWDVINTVCRSFFIPSYPHVLIFFFSKVFEDYSEEEQEKYKEELDSIKKRFSHTKLKRKWVSFFNCPAVRRRTKKSVSVCTADNKESHFLDTKQ